MPIGIFLRKKEFSMYEPEMKHHFLLIKTILLPGFLYFLYLLKEVFLMSKQEFIVEMK